MKSTLTIALVAASIAVWAQGVTTLVSPTAGPGKINNLHRSEAKSKTLPFEQALAPFYHGVASGDPLAKRVIIWTRRTPDTDQPSYELGWQMATDPEMQNVVRQGLVDATATRDFTVKVDVAGLQPATTYYYRFFDFTSEMPSIIGRTRTAPEADEVDQLKFAVVSCNNYQAGYFNAFRKIGMRQDLDAVIHLGDYIYEYGAGEGTYGYSDDRPDRANVPDTEILTLADYRTRYSLYRLDADLRVAHQQHPFITVWDDHESSNDAYTDGAENHNEGEGEWETRKAISKQVYYEWMPIRDLPQDRLYRTLKYGELADLIMIDTRLEGREVQPLLASDTMEYRTLLGEDQLKWLQNQVKNSTAKWKVIGNQVIFSPFNVGFGAEDPTDITQITLIESIFVDIWDGYPKERKRLLDALRESQIDNVVILTGDFHSSFAFDVAIDPVIYPNPFAFNLPTPSASYNPATGEGSLAVEFATPSVTSANFDENVSPEESAAIELAINANLPALPPLNSINYNPHMKYADLDQHGYFLLNLTAEQVQADWYYVDILTPMNDAETYGTGMRAMDGENRLESAEAEAPEKTDPPALAPLFSANQKPAASGSTNDTDIPFAIFNLYPNPVRQGGMVYVMLGYAGEETFTLELLDMAGRTVFAAQGSQNPGGTFTMAVPVDQTLATGMYFIKLNNGSQSLTRKLIVE